MRQEWGRIANERYITEWKSKKNWNTHKLLLEAERGAEEMGAETEIIHLYDLNYTDCKSCFACKLRGNKTNGVCAVRDDLRPVSYELGKRVCS